MARNLIAEQEARGAVEVEGPLREVSRATGDISGLSSQEQRRRRRRARSDQSGMGDESAKTKRKKFGSRPHLTLTRALDMVTEAAEFLHETVVDTEAKCADRKHSSVGLGVMLDKWAMLSGRPTQIIQVGEAEARRPAVNRLAAKVVRLVHSV